MNSDPEQPLPGKQTEADESPESESKSQRKRNAKQITALAGKLVEMKPKALAALPVEPSVLDAVRHCAEIRAHGARKRQLHFVSKLLRESSNIEELQKLVDRPDLNKSSSSANPHLGFRNQLLDNLAENVDELRNLYPSVDLQQVRQLVRNAHTEYNKHQTDSENTSSLTSTRPAKTLLRLLQDSQS